MIRDSIRIAALLIATSLIPLPALAGFGGSDDSAWILSAGTSAGLNLQTGSPQTTIWDLRLGVGHSLTSSFELMLLASYLSVSSDGYPSNATAEADVQLNWVLIGGHADAFYVGPRVGIQYYNRYGNVYQQQVFGAAAGKRFPISGIVGFSPEASIVWYDTAGAISTPAIQFTPIQFDFVF